ncbi:MAG: GntR family transcriptional regulator [Planctomycetota bacterium]
MQLHLDRHSGVPVFRQIVDQVRFQVASGILKAGEELPSTRSLSADLGLNPMTVSKAYSLLETEGLVQRRPGLALVVRALDQARLITQKQEQLREALRPAVQAAQQLGLGSDEALATFAGLLSRPHDSTEDSP